MVDKPRHWAVEVARELTEKFFANDRSPAACALFQRDITGLKATADPMNGELSALIDAEVACASLPDLTSGFDLPTPDGIPLEPNFLVENDPFRENEDETGKMIYDRAKARFLKDIEDGLLDESGNPIEQGKSEEPEVEALDSLVAVFSSGWAPTGFSTTGYVSPTQETIEDQVPAKKLPELDFEFKDIVTQEMIDELPDGYKYRKVKTFDGPFNGLDTKFKTKYELVRTRKSRPDPAPETAPKKVLTKPSGKIDYQAERQRRQYQYDCAKRDLQDSRKHLFLSQKELDATQNALYGTGYTGVFKYIKDNPLFDPRAATDPELEKMFREVTGMWTMPVDLEKIRNACEYKFTQIKVKAMANIEDSLKGARDFIAHDVESLLIKNGGSYPQAKCAVKTQDLARVMVDTALASCGDQISNPNATHLEVRMSQNYVNKKLVALGKKGYSMTKDYYRGLDHLVMSGVITGYTKGVQHDRKSCTTVLVPIVKGPEKKVRILESVGCKIPPILAAEHPSELTSTDTHIQITEADVDRYDAIAACHTRILEEIETERKAALAFMFSNRRRQEALHEDKVSVV